MNETTKCYALRHERGDFRKYLNGEGIDVGAGNDPLRIERGQVTIWDKQHGDAQYLNSIEDESFDFLYSSHCLEHLISVNTAMANWSRVVRLGGFLYIVVPDYLLYEKLQWPSRYNPDHRQSFSCHITRDLVNRPNHWHMAQDLTPVFDRLHLRLERLTTEDDGFDYNRGPVDQTLGLSLSQLCVVLSRQG